MASYTNYSSSSVKADDLAAHYVTCWRSWREELRQYWEQIDKNQEMYEFYRRDAVENEFDDLSLNTPFAIVESIVAKANETTLNVTVKAQGENYLGDFEEWVSAVLKQAIEDPDVAKFYGSFRKIREMFLRDFLVKGNAVAQVNWCYKKSSGGKVLADNPYTSLLSLKSLVFDPTKTIATSGIYYIEGSAKFSDLKADGSYKNLNKIKEKASDEGRFIDTEDQVFILPDRKVNRKADPIHLLEVWDGDRYLVIADHTVVIKDEKDPLKIGGHNLLIAMNYAIEGRPYAYGEIDGIYKPTRIQDTIINQNIAIINRYLKPGFMLNDDQIDTDQFVLLLENGGVLPGNINSVGSLSEKLPTPPPQAFTQVQELQQAVEKTARFSLYSAGVTSSSTDETAGTKGGIQSLQAAAEPNFQIKIDTIEDSFMEPLANIYLAMIGENMGPKEVRYGLLQNKSAGWVKVTKGILKGKATITELVEAGIIEQQVADSYTMAILPTVDPLGNPARSLQPIPGADKAVLFDLNWIVKVRLDNQSASMKYQEFSRKLNLIETGLKMGVQFDPVKTIERLGQEMDFSDVCDLIIQPAPAPAGMPMGAPGAPQGQPGMPPGAVPPQVPMAAPGGVGQTIS